MKTIIQILIIFTTTFSVSAQTVVKMDMPPQADEKLSVVALFDEEIPEGIPVVLGVMGYSIQGGIAPYTFEWVLNGEVVSTSDILVFTPQKGDILSLTVTDKNSCRASTSFNLKVARLSQSSSIEKENKIDIYPTVVTDHVNIGLPDNTDMPALMRVIDLSGKIILRRELQGTGTVNMNITPGIYFISVRAGEMHKVEKIIVK